MTGTNVRELVSWNLAIPSSFGLLDLSPALYFGALLLNGLIEVQGSFPEDFSFLGNCRSGKLPSGKDSLGKTPLGNFQTSKSMP